MLFLHYLISLHFSPRHLLDIRSAAYYNIHKVSPKKFQKIFLYICKNKKSHKVSIFFLNDFSHLTFMNNKYTYLMKVIFPVD